MRGIHQGWEISAFPDKDEYMSATEPFLVIFTNHLAMGERPIYVASFPLRDVPLCCSTEREVEERLDDALQG